MKNIILCLMSVFSVMIAGQQNSSASDYNDIQTAFDGDTTPIMKSLVGATNVTCFFANDTTATTQFVFGYFRNTKKVHMYGGWLINPAAIPSDNRPYNWEYLGQVFNGKDGYPMSGLWESNAEFKNNAYSIYLVTRDDHYRHQFNELLVRSDKTYGFIVKSSIRSLKNSDEFNFYCRSEKVAFSCDQVIPAKYQGPEGCK